MIILYALATALGFLISIGFILFVFWDILALFNSVAPFVPIPKIIEDEVIENLGLRKNSVFYDLGSGDGRILIKATKKYKEITTVGIEKAFIPYLLSKFYSRKYKNIEIRRENFFKADISKATNIFVYLSEEGINKLIENIEKQCRKGTILVSCDFKSAKLVPTKIIELQNKNSLRGKKLFVYII